MDSAYKRLEVTAGCDMDSWSSVWTDNWQDYRYLNVLIEMRKLEMERMKCDSVSMPVRGLGISFEGHVADFGRLDGKEMAKNGVSLPMESGKMTQNTGVRPKRTVKGRHLVGNAN